MFSSSYPLLIFSYTLVLSIPVTWLVSAESHWPKLSVMNPFHLVLSWFHIRFYEILAIALLLFMAIRHKEIAQILNERLGLYQYMERLHREVTIQSMSELYSRRLWTLWSFLLLRIVNVVLYTMDISEEIHPFHLSMTMWQLKFPFFVFVLANNLFLETISFLVVLVRKLRMVLEKGLADAVSVHSWRKLGDLLDQVAEGYSTIFSHKKRIRSFISYAMLLLTIQRFVEVIIRVFYIYSLCRGDLLSDIDLQLLSCQLIDLLVVTLEFCLISKATGGLEEEVSTGITPVDLSIHDFLFSSRNSPNRFSTAAEALRPATKETIPQRCLLCSSCTRRWTFGLRDCFP